MCNGLLLRCVTTFCHHRVVTGLRRMFASHESRWGRACAAMAYDVSTQRSDPGEAAAICTPSAPSAWDCANLAWAAAATVGCLRRLSRGLGLDARRQQCICELLGLLHAHSCLCIYHDHVHVQEEESSGSTMGLCAIRACARGRAVQGVTRRCS